MVKKNKLLIGCLSLLLVLSVGYALFSETVTINGTATAKGSFDITTTCVPGYGEELLGLAGIPSVDYEQAGFENSICDVKDNVVAMTTDLLYPTAKRLFTVKMRNTGSIPAVIWVPAEEAEDAGLDIDEDNASWYLRNKETDAIIKSGKGNWVEKDNDINKAHNGHKFISYSWQTGVLSSTGEVNSDNNVIYDKSRDFVGLILNPGDTVFSVAGFVFPELSNLVMSDNGKSEYLELKLNYEFKWEQYTDSPNYESTTFYEWCFYMC